MSPANETGNVRHRSYGAVFTRNEEPGVVSGYGSVFGERNSYGEVFVRGAFDETLKAKTDSKPLVMGWQHREIIGRWTDHTEDAHGLKLSGKVSDTSLGRDALTLIGDGAVTGLSVGFWPVIETYVPAGEEFKVNDQTYKQDRGTFYIQKADLMETSIVMAPSDDNARLDRGRAVERAFPGLRSDDWSELAYSMALLMGGKGAGMLDLAEPERRAIYTELARSYAELERTPPEFTDSPDFKAVPFNHDEREVFADTYLRKRLADVDAGLRGIDGPLSAETTAAASAVVQSINNRSAPDYGSLAASLDEIASKLSALAGAKGDDSDE